MSDRFNLDGRVALITGGGTGIGRGSAMVLAEHGADVVLAGRRVEPLESTAKDIDELGGGHWQFQPMSAAPTRVNSSSTRPSQSWAE